GVLAPNQSCEKACGSEVSSGPGDDPASMKIAERPGASDVTPRSATAVPKERESSSIFQPVRSTVVLPKFVTSHQSARSVAGELPLDHGAPSVTATVPGGAFSFGTSVSVSVYEADASGVTPTDGSSTSTLTW